MPPGVDEHSSATLRKLAATRERVDCELSMKNSWKAASEPDSAASAAALAILAQALLALLTASNWVDEQSDCRVLRFNSVRSAVFLESTINDKGSLIKSRDLPVSSVDPSLAYGMY